MKRRKLRSAITLASVGTTVHDRQATQLPTAAIVAPLDVQDPYDPAGTIRVVRNLRGDPLATLHARGQLDDALFMAGRTWQRIYETAGPLKGQDTTREPVDGGGFHADVLTERRRKAIAKLTHCRAILGVAGDELIRDILGRGMFFVEIADSRGLVRKREIEFLGYRFRECLETLAREFGYA